MQAEAFTGMEEVCEQIMEGMKGYGIKRLGIYYRDKNGEEIALTDAEEKQSLLEVDEADIFDEPVMLNVADTVPRLLTLILKRWSFFIFW
jgi:type IV secretion system protein VirB4